MLPRSRAVVHVRWLARVPRAGLRSSLASDICERRARGALRARARATIGLAASALLVGCSIIGWTYDHLDWIVLRYANQYLDLNEAQQTRFRDRFSKVWGEHRTDVLPQVSSWLAAAEHAAADGFNQAELVHLRAGAVALYDTHARDIITVLSPTLAELSDEQLEHLGEALGERNEEFAEKFGLEGNAEKRLELRIERMTERLENWVGTPTDSQRELIGAIARESPDHIERWYQYRLENQRALTELVARAADPTEIATLLEAWWIVQSDLGDASYLRSPAAHQQITRTLLRLDATFSERQREHLMERLAKLRHQIQALNDRPSAKTSLLPQDGADG